MTVQDLIVLLEHYRREHGNVDVYRADTQWRYHFSIDSVTVERAALGLGEDARKTVARSETEYGGTPATHTIIVLY